MSKARSKSNEIVRASLLSESQIEAEINRFFSSSTHLASTYKPYLFKSLLDLRKRDSDNPVALSGHRWISESIDTGQLVVDLNFVAVRFAWWYWPLLFKFKLRQSPNPSKDVHIYPLLIQLSNQKKNTDRPSIEDFCKPEYAEFRNEVIQTCIKPLALWKLQKDCQIYDIGGDSIIISKLVVRFFKEHHNLLLAALNFNIAKYLEGINQAPNIAEKVTGTLQRTVLSSKMFSLIKNDQNNRCFYCGAPKIEAQEHVVPWNYLYDTKPFNIVGACRECNSKKNDRLPTDSTFQNVLSRNARLFSQSDGYSEALYRNIFSSCKVEYNSELWTPPLT